MASSKHAPCPVCAKCEQTMVWVSELKIDFKPMQIFRCDSCEKYAAALPDVYSVKKTMAPSIAPSAATGH